MACLLLTQALRYGSAAAGKACLLEECDGRVGGEQGLMQQQLRQDAPEGPHVHLWPARLLPQDLQSYFMVSRGGGEELVTALPAVCIASYYQTPSHEERV